MRTDNAVHIERVNLTGGPIDLETVLVYVDQDEFRFWRADRIHVYRRIGTSRNFLHSSIQACTCPADEGANWVVASSSILPDLEPQSIRLIKILHRLRRLMG
jgi:hypothetical protein